MLRVLVFASILFLPLAGGCGREVPSSSPMEDPSIRTGSDSSGQPGEEMAPDPQLEDFLHQAEILVRMFVERAPSAEETQLAIEEGPEAFARLIGMTPEESGRFMEELRRRAEELMLSHPRLEAGVDELERRGAPVCDSWELVRMADEIQQAHALGMPPLSKEDRVICRVLPYTMALLTCSLTGNPIVYAACAVVAMCAYCSGGFVSSLCNYHL